jgi:hypothetical protein
MAYYNRRYAGRSSPPTTLEITYRDGIWFLSQLVGGVRRTISSHRLREDAERVRRALLEA